MNNYNLGYACINTELSSRKIKVSTNRTMRRKTFDEKGLDHVSEIILQNVTDLLTILQMERGSRHSLFQIVLRDLSMGFWNMLWKTSRTLIKLKKHYLNAACLLRRTIFV